MTTVFIIKAIEAGVHEPAIYNIKVCLKLQSRANLTRLLKEWAKHKGYDHTLYRIEDEEIEVDNALSDLINVKEEVV